MQQEFFPHFEISLALSGLLQEEQATEQVHRQRGRPGPARDEADGAHASFVCSVPRKEPSMESLSPSLYAAFAVALIDVAGAIAAMIIVVDVVLATTAISVIVITGYTSKRFLFIVAILSVVS